MAGRGTGAAPKPHGVTDDRTDTTQMAYIDAQTDAARTWAELERALGGFHP